MSNSANQDRYAFIHASLLRNAGEEADAGAAEESVVEKATEVAPAYQPPGAMDPIVAGTLDEAWLKLQEIEVILIEASASGDTTANSIYSKFKEFMKTMQGAVEANPATEEAVSTKKTSFGPSFTVKAGLFGGFTLEREGNA